MASRRSKICIFICVQSKRVSAKAIVSLTLFHEGRIFITNQFKQHNLKKLEP